MSCPNCDSKPGKRLCVCAKRVETISPRSTRWEPKNGKTVLDAIGSDYAPGFQFKLLRNGHVVALYASESAAISAMNTRRVALPLDTWQWEKR